MNIRTCALAASLALASFVTPKIAQADTVQVNLNNITYDGPSVCGAGGTSPCILTLNGSFQWDNTAKSAVPGSLSATASGPINLASLAVSGLLTSPQFSIDVTFTDPGGDSAIFGINFATMSLPLGTYTLTNGSPTPGTFSQIAGNCVTAVCLADVNVAASSGTVTVTATPEPQTLVLLLPGLAALVGIAYRLRLA